MQKILAIIIAVVATGWPFLFKQAFAKCVMSPRNAWTTLGLIVGIPVYMCLWLSAFGLAMLLWRGVGSEQWQLLPSFFARTVWTLSKLGVPMLLPFSVLIIAPAHFFIFRAQAAPQHFAEKHRLRCEQVAAPLRLGAAKDAELPLKFKIEYSPTRSVATTVLQDSRVGGGYFNQTLGIVKLRSGGERGIAAKVDPAENAGVKGVKIKVGEREYLVDPAHAEWWGIVLKELAGTQAKGLAQVDAIHVGEGIALVTLGSQLGSVDAYEQFDGFTATLEQAVKGVR